MVTSNRVVKNGGKSSVRMNSCIIGIRIPPISGKSTSLMGWYEFCSSLVSSPPKTRSVVEKSHFFLFLGGS